MFRLTLILVMAVAPLFAQQAPLPPPQPPVYAPWAQIRKGTGSEVVNEVDDFLFVPLDHRPMAGLFLAAWRQELQPTLSYSNHPILLQFRCLAERRQTRRLRPPRFDRERLSGLLLANQAEVPLQHVAPQSQPLLS